MIRFTLIICVLLAANFIFMRGHKTAKEPATVKTPATDEASVAVDSTAGPASNDPAETPVTEKDGYQSAAEIRKKKKLKTKPNE